MSRAERSHRVPDLQLDLAIVDLHHARAELDLHTATTANRRRISDEQTGGRPSSRPSPPSPPCRVCLGGLFIPRQCALCSGTDPDGEVVHGLEALVRELKKQTRFASSQPHTRRPVERQPTTVRRGCTPAPTHSGAKQSRAEQSRRTRWQRGDSCSSGSGSGSGSIVRRLHSTGLHVPTPVSPMMMYLKR